MYSTGGLKGILCVWHESISGSRENECYVQRYAWVEIIETVGYEILAELRGLQAFNDQGGSEFDVPYKSTQDLETLQSYSNSGILIRIAKNAVPDLVDSDFEIESAMATANERRGSWRE